MLVVFQKKILNKSPYSSSSRVPLMASDSKHRKYNLVLVSHNCINPFELLSCRATCLCDLCFINQNVFHIFHRLPLILPFHLKGFLRLPNVFLLWVVEESNVSFHFNYLKIIDSKTIDPLSLFLFHSMLLKMVRVSTDLNAIAARLID